MTCGRLLCTLRTRSASRARCCDGSALLARRSRGARRGARPFSRARARWLFTAKRGARFRLLPCHRTRSPRPLPRRFLPPPPPSLPPRTLRCRLRAQNRGCLRPAMAAGEEEVEAAEEEEEEALGSFRPRFPFAACAAVRPTPSDAEHRRSPSARALAPVRRPRRQGRSRARGAPSAATAPRATPPLHLPLSRARGHPGTTRVREARGAATATMNLGAERVRAGPRPRSLHCPAPKPRHLSPTSPLRPLPPPRRRRRQPRLLLLLLRRRGQEVLRPPRLTGSSGRAGARAEAGATAAARPTPPALVRACAAPYRGAVHARARGRGRGLLRTPRPPPHPHERRRMRALTHRRRSTLRASRGRGPRALPTTSAA